jgi:hypothetical protein
MDVKETFKILQMPNKRTALMPLAPFNFELAETRHPTLWQAVLASGVAIADTRVFASRYSHQFLISISSSSYPGLALRNLHSSNARSQYGGGYRSGSSVRLSCL